MQKILGAILLIFVLSGCTNEKEIQEEPKEVVSVEDKVQLPSFDSIENPIITLNNQVGFDSIYQKVCWSDCTEEEKLNHDFNNTGQAQIGDVINVKWDNMKFAPNKVEIREYTNEFNQIGDTQVITDGQKNYYLELADTSYDKIYELVFVWEDSKSPIGKSRLAFQIIK